MPFVASWVAALSLCALARSPDDDDDDRAPMRVEFDFDAMSIEGAFVAPSGSGFGATPGGAQDIRYFRDRVAAGEVPLASVFTAEGLFSEHDLPLSSGACERLLCARTKTIEGRVPTVPDIRFVTQVGFDTGLDPATFRRAPLDLVAVVDKSCSMSGDKIETVRAALHTVVDGLTADDQLSIVLYGSSVHTLLGATSGSQRAALHAAVDGITIDGSTNLEAGLVAGFDLARRNRARFDGTSRVMLFTDERPNTGRTDAEGFIGLAQAASRGGVGMTTIGVGVDFGAELAQEVSSVRGGNLFFFPDTASMKERFVADFDTMVTELAYDFDLEVRPAPGMRVAGVFGVPGDLVQWGEGGAISMHVSTLFLSRSEGAMYVAFAADGEDRSVPDRAGEVTLSYTPLDGGRVPETSSLAIGRVGRGDEGLPRGLALIDEVTTLKTAAAQFHDQNDAEGAYQRVHALLARLSESEDAALEEERVMVRALDSTLAKLTGHSPDPAVAVRDPITGLPSPYDPHW